VALWCTYDVAILFEPPICRLVLASSGKELYRLAVSILTAVRVLTVSAFQNRIINNKKVIPNSTSLRIVYLSLLLCWPIINLAVTARRERRPFYI
jgi:hypothetical protein